MQYAMQKIKCLITVFICLNFWLMVFLADKFFGRGGPCVVLDLTVTEERKFETDFGKSFRNLASKDNFDQLASGMTYLHQVNN